ncbi:MAG: peptidoglycan DD-metalloendopeptidase family protein [Patescibacteria group bacterium]|nr:peptidoglycan DD-metalloendopeptidase family protein [Patescibacteria group bacterium]MCL5224134.1 peptidoglycan DD-metalloendopeptidase family protein [Patescibacteria group bacterium]
MPAVSVIGLFIITVLLIKPVFPAPFPASQNLPGSSYLALEGGAIASAAGPASAQPAVNGPSEYVQDDGSVLASATPVNGLSLTPDGLVLYKVNKGDTVKGLATKFNISTNTILWANRLNRGAPLIVGQELIILPVSGVLYEVQQNDTVSSIAAAYKASPADIIPLTGSAGSIQTGEMVVIKNGVPPKTSSKTSQLPNLDSYFISPVSGGLNTGLPDSNNGVDVTSFCGAPVYAAAEGLVTDVGDPSQSNNGLGGFVKISHLIDGVQTIYAHTASNEVAVGDFVYQGQEIAKTGNSGEASVGGCDLYFEVVGARNSLAK